MSAKKNILVINGSASFNSSNHRLIENIEKLGIDDFNFMMLGPLSSFPHFDPGLSGNNPPSIIVGLRERIQNADGVLICTPEYVFSIPSGLKNVLEWCVATTIFENKPTGVITASANGQMAHEELQMILRTIMAKLSPQATLLIPGIRGKISQQGIVESDTLKKLEEFVNGLATLVRSR